MSDQGCLIKDCTSRPYAPAGTGSVCKEHFLDFVRWRRRKGPGMFRTYGAMTMVQRDTVVADWRKNVTIE
jgi:hypothetical protein